MIRLATQQDKRDVNRIRIQVQMLHASARPDMFRADFCAELADRFDLFVDSDEYEIAVCDDGNSIVGLVVMKRVILPESPYAVERKFLLVEEFGVDEKYRRSGVGAQLMEYVKGYAKNSGFSRIQLDLWTFNASAEEILPRARFYNISKLYENSV